MKGACLNKPRAQMTARHCDKLGGEGACIDVNFQCCFMKPIGSIF